MYYFSYLCVRLIGFFLSRLSYKSIHRLGTFLGSIAFVLHRPFHKKAMTSLAIAFESTFSEKERKNIARRSFQNLMITCLEFFRLKKSKGKIDEIVHLKSNPSVQELLDKKQGVIFLSAHQANWEIPFLVLTNRYKGIAIGRPIKNPYLYKYVMSVREMHGGRIIMPKEATKEGLRALKSGIFLGIVGDQAYPTSSYSYPLLGTRAFTAATPALLAYKTNCPIIVGTCRRIKGHYIVAGSDPIWPDLSKPLKEELPRMMDNAMSLLEASILKDPQQWMWVHDRYKQQGINNIKRKYRYSFLLIILPPDPAPYLSCMQTFTTLYPKAFITVFVPKGKVSEIAGCTLIEYENENDLFIRDWRYQILFDFYDSKKARRHFKKLGVFAALTLHDMKKNSREESFDKIIEKTVVKCLKTDSI